VQAVAGSALAAFGDRVPWPAGARPVAQEHDRAAALLNLALQAARAGAGVDAALALPLYLRDKVAQTTQERDAVRAAAQAATP
jgi:tRNA threonylcarbamoyladenosine biosynthesis protein TsaB